jgi:hypothetical protein
MDLNQMNADRICMYIVHTFCILLLIIIVTIMFYGTTRVGFCPNTTRTNQVKDSTSKGCNYIGKRAGWPNIICAHNIA